LFDRATFKPASSFIRLYWHQTSFLLLLYGQRIDTHLTDPKPPFRTDRGFSLVFDHRTNRRSSSAFFQKKAVDRYLYAWVRTGEGLAPRRFSSQNFYVPGVKLRYTYSK